MVNTAARAISPPINSLQTSIVTSSSSLQHQPMNPPAQTFRFSDNFWGEKINGFDILCQNLKQSLTSVKDLETFLREGANCEDTYGKVLNKLVAQINRFSPHGSFNPLWLPLKELNEKYAAKHVDMTHQLHELIKDIQRYNDELSKKIKKIRENEIQTQNVVQSFQEIQIYLNKTKEQYHNLCVDFEKQKRQLDPQQLAQYQQQQMQQQISSTNLLASANPSTSSLLNGSSSTNSSNSTSLLNTNTSNINLQAAANSNLNNSSQPVVQSPSPAPTSTTDRLSSLASSITVSKVSQVQKAEKKLRLALEEYKSTIDKYNTIRVDFERKLADSCDHFQYAEDTHLKQMRVFIETYSKIISSANTSKQQIYSDFQSKFEQNTSDYLLQLFVDNKRTGIERPEAAQFVDQFDYAKTLAIQNGLLVSPNNNSNNGNSNQTLINETDFNLFINGSNQFTNTSLNTSYLSTNSSSLLPPAPPPLVTSSSQQHVLTQQTSNSFLNSNQHLLTSTTDLVDNRQSNGDFSTQSRGTPIFFSSTNIIGNSTYSPLTNSVSTTTLNSLPQPIMNNVSAGGTASPINFPTNGTSAASTNVSTTTTNNDNMKRSDSKGINIFNVDFLGRNKNKEKKAAQKAAAAAAAALANETNLNTKSKNKNNKKNKQSSSTTTTSTSQYENLNSTSTTNTFKNGGLSVSNTSNRDSSSINSEDSNERADQANTSNNLIQNVDSQITQGGIPNPGSITARSISSITGSLSLDLLDPLKVSNGSDIDSEGYSIRPESSIGFRRKNKDNVLKNKDNDDMNNLYASSTTNSDSDDSDSENGDGTGPIKVNIKIKPKTEDEKKTNNDDVLREISKNLQLIKPLNNLQLNNNKQQAKKRTYYYNYGTSNPDQATSGWINTPDAVSKTDFDSSINSMMTRSVSVGSVAHTSQLLGDFSFNSTQTNNNKSTTNTTNTDSLFDFGLFPPTNSKPIPNPTPAVPNSVSMNKVTESNLYNIEEDKEVESSFQYDNKRSSNYTSSSPANPSSNLSNQSTSNTTANNITNNGRFTPACFPGRTTPDFRITTSLFEQQGTRASIISPLTINGSGCDIIPIAVAFNETIHSYFKTGDISKFKVKCFGCMKISFPFAVLKYLNSELPQLEFKLSNLQIANQDLKINNQLLTRSNEMSLLNESFQFKFTTPNLVQELKQQHQQNKLAAFFNFELLKYEFKYSNTPPLTLNASWSNNPIDNTIELTLNYIHNFRKNLSQVNFMIVMPTGVGKSTSNSTDKITLIKSEPNAMVQENDSKLQILWQVPVLNSNGTISAKFSIPTSFTLNQSFNSSLISNPLEHYYQPVYVKFNIENDTLSQVKFEILSNQYKLSLLKERIETGKYFCNNDHQNNQQQLSNSQTSEQLNQNLVSTNAANTTKKAPFAGNLSTSIGSTVDIFLNH